MRLLSCRPFMAAINGMPIMKFMVRPSHGLNHGFRTSMDDTFSWRRRGPLLIVLPANAQLPPNVLFSPDFDHFILKAWETYFHFYFWKENHKRSCKSRCWDSGSSMALDWMSLPLIAQESVKKSRIERMHIFKMSFTFLERWPKCRYIGTG